MTLRTAPPDTTSPPEREDSTPAPSDRALRAPAARLRAWGFAGAVAATTGLGTLMMLDIVRAAGVTGLEVGILALFVPTFAWISVAFWNASIGFVLSALAVHPVTMRRVRASVARGRQLPHETPLTARTALVMPAHNEDPLRLVDALAITIESLESTGCAGHFDVHLLSDTTDAELARSEELAWERLREAAPRPARLHYRRRARNVGRKAGNIADFCERWGDDYDLFVVLDADSVMSGRTLVELVRTMEANPRAGLIQTVPIPARQETVFGRFVQFAASLYSPMLATGQAFWQTDSANYWGHNAIIRMAAFRRHAKLPVLPGRPPLGGPVLSHDFVEAALLRRAGWLVYLLPGLEGSFEEVPANLLDYARRDRRWAQGSLQHLRLLSGRGFSAMSKVHFGLGAMGYLSSVLWLALLLASTAYVLVPALSDEPLLVDQAVPRLGWVTATESMLPLLAVTAAVLFVPKVLGLLLALGRRRAAFGGAGRLVAGAVAEATFSVVIAPLMMYLHTRSVLQILGGGTVAWTTQSRVGRQVGWGEALRATAGMSAAGAAWAAATLLTSPLFFVWLSPIFFGLVFAAPIVRWTGAPRGRATLARRMLRVPSEAASPDGPGLGPERASGAARMFARPERPPQERSRSTMYQVERGLFDLRRGRPVCVIGEEDGPSILCAAVEGLDAAGLDVLRRLGSGPLRLVVTRFRARTLGLPTRAGDVSLGLNGDSAAQVYSLASAPEGFERRDFDARPADDAERAALYLARIGRLLPAVVTVPSRPDRVPELCRALESAEILSLEARQIREIAEAPRGEIEVTSVSGAHVPLEDAEEARFLLFREANGMAEHVAVLIGDPDTWPDPVPVRLHSACLTGDLFGSLKCDCGEQLRGSLRYFVKDGGGVLLYLHQEGRGIGLGNKLRAYALQQQGLDTVDADGVLGFDADERDYDAAIGMLKHLGIERVRLLTNNPDKVRALENGGIDVVSRQPLHGTLNRHNLPYVRAKVDRAGHWLRDMLRGPNPGT